jgi:ATP-dependent Clp protease ATP-binding subunit ClpA
MDDDDVYIELEESEQDRVISTDAVIVTDYSPHARNVIETAEAAAANAPGGVLTCEHLLMSLAGNPECAAAQVMAQCGFPGESVIRTISFIAGPQPVQEPAAEIVRSPRADRVLTGASIEAGNRNAEQIDTLHLLFALIRERHGIAAAALETPGVGHEIVGAALSNAMRNGMTDPS